MLEAQEHPFPPSLGPGTTFLGEVASQGHQVGTGSDVYPRKSPVRRAVHPYVTDVVVEAERG